MEFGLNDFNYSVSETLGMTGTIYAIPNKVIGSSETLQNLYVVIPLYDNLSLLYNRRKYSEVYNEYGKAIRLNYYIKTTINSSNNTISCEFYDSKIIRYEYNDNLDKYVNSTTASYITKTNNKYYLNDKYGNQIELDNNNCYPNSITYKDDTSITFTKNNGKLITIFYSKNNLTISFEYSNTLVNKITITSDVIENRNIDIEYAYSSGSYSISKITYKKNEQVIQTSSYTLNNNSKVELKDNTNKNYITITLEDTFHVNKIIKTY